MFIPQAWEGFVNSAAAEALAAVHPTGVGMIRAVHAPGESDMGSSHRRGNDSPTELDKKRQKPFIPQAWE